MTPLPPTLNLFKQELKRGGTLASKHKWMDKRNTDINCTKADQKEQKKGSSAKICTSEDEVKCVDVYSDDVASGV